MHGSYKDAIHQKGKKMIVKKNEFLYDPNISETIPYAYYLESGLCALSCITKEGEEKVYLYFGPDRMVGFNQLMAKVPGGIHYKANFYITTKADCIAYRIHETDFHQLISECKDFNDFIFHVLAQNYNDALIRFHQLQEESATLRLCRLLLTHSDGKNGERILPKYFTYSEMSKYLGTHPVTVARIMSKLKQYGYIEKIGHSIIIHEEDKLQQLINSNTELEY